MKAKRSLLPVLAMMCLFLLLPFAAHGQEMTDMPMPTDSATSVSPEVAKLVADVRHTTAGFRDFSTAEPAGYGKFLDCFTNAQVGGMGQHYVNGDLVGDDVADPMKPEALVYEPDGKGNMNLVAFEYLIFADKWDPNNTGKPAPMLFDRPMHLMTNIPNTPPVWALHLWLWTDNPDGLFSNFNPIVFCPADQPITDMTPNS